MDHKRYIIDKVSNPLLLCRRAIINDIKSIRDPNFSTEQFQVRVMLIDRFLVNFKSMITNLPLESIKFSLCENSVIGCTARHPVNLMWTIKGRLLCFLCGVQYNDLTPDDGHKERIGVCSHCRRRTRVEYIDIDSSKGCSTSSIICVECSMRSCVASNAITYSRMNKF